MNRINGIFAGIALLVHAGACAAAEPEDGRLIDDLTKAGFSLRQSISGPTKPATFSYEKTGGENFFSSQFALVYFNFDDKLSAASGSSDLYFRQFAIEGDLGGGDEHRKNSFLRFNASLANYHYIEPGTINGFYQRLGPVYEATKDFSIENIYGEYEIVPVYDKWAVGVYQPLLPGIYYQLLPSFIFDFGSNLRRDAETFEQEKTVLRVMPYFAASISFRDFSRYVGLYSTIFSVSNKTTYLPIEGERVHNFVNTSLDFGLTKHVHFVLSYSKGRQAPTYVDTPDFAVKLGIQFGKGNMIDPGP